MGDVNDVDAIVFVVCLVFYSTLAVCWIVWHAFVFARDQWRSWRASVRRRRAYHHGTCGVAPARDHR